MFYLCHLNDFKERFSCICMFSSLNIIQGYNRLGKRLMQIYNLYSKFQIGFNRIS